MQVRMALLWPVSLWAAQLSRHGEDMFLKCVLAMRSEVWAMLLLVLWEMSTYWCQRSQDRLWPEQDLVPTALVGNLTCFPGISIISVSLKMSRFGSTICLINF